MLIYRALGEAGIEIPFPQRDLWVRRLPAAAEAGEV
jgi:small-conductance mechanosensitive channel